MDDIIACSTAVRQHQFLPTPYMRAVEDAQSTVEAACQRFRELMSAAIAVLPSSPGQFLVLEKDTHAQVARLCVDPVVGACLKVALTDPVVLERAAAIVANTPELHAQSASKDVDVVLLGGSEVTVKTKYYLRRKPTRGGRRRGRGRRHVEGNGLYPALAALGVHYRATPALASDVARLVALSTEAEAHETLLLRGLWIGRKTIRRLAQRFAKRALKLREWKQEQTRAGYRGRGQVAGRRLVIGTDGGRLRLREVRKRSRRRANGHRCFDAPWREPRVLIVYEIDEKGRKLREGLVRYDAVIRDADGVFEILVSLLREIGAHEAKEWIFVGDGADWIWDRIPGLIKEVGYDSSKVTEVVDFYHAMQRVQAIAEERKDWSQQDRTDWVNTMRQHLKRGNVDEVYTAASELCRGRRSKQVKSLLGYFITHAERMHYDDYRKRGIPLGSGAVESCVRRTINLRLKGNGIFWLKETANGVLHIRAQILSGRWNQHVIEVLEPEALWKLPLPSERGISRAM